MSATKPVTLIKLGGAIITDKSIPNTLRPQTLTDLVAVLSEFWKQGDTHLVVGHGAGSFAHVPAARYKTLDGFQDDESRLGMAIVQDSAAQLNRIVVSEFLKHAVPAVSVCPSNTLITKQRVASRYFSDVFREYLHQGLLPITYGDVIVDELQGCTIWSTDTILAFFAREFLRKNWPVARIIHVTQVPGVLRNVKHPEQGIFAEITEQNKEEVRAAMGVTTGFDVTGGMWLKIEESLQLAKEHGTETIILGGENPNVLAAALSGAEFVGTRIH